MSVQEILSIRLELEPMLFMLSLYPEGHRIKHLENFFINICSLQAKRTFALSWKHYGKPSITVWFRELTSCLPLQRISYTLKDRQEEFQNVWGCFINYMKDYDLLRLKDRPEKLWLDPVHHPVSPTLWTL